MLTEICAYLHNWFCEDSDMIVGNIVIGDSEITVPNVVIQPGQYIRIIGSVFNDGVWQYGEATFRPETFDGAVWLMRIPQTVIQLATDIEDWQAKYGSVDSKAMSPFNSESFGGYSYSKSGGGSAGSSSVPTWQSVYASRLRRYRRLREL